TDRSFDIQKKPLSQVEVDKLFTNVPPLPVEEKQNISLPETSPSPASPKETSEVRIDEVEQVKATNLPEKSRPLTVLSYSPQGDVPEAKQLTVHFSEPMVAISSQDHIADSPVPVTVLPAVPGEWYWLGTRTACFVPKAGRFPMATRYIVRIANA